MNKKRDKNMRNGKTRKPMTRDRYALLDTIKNTRQEEGIKITQSNYE